MSTIGDTEILKLMNEIQTLRYTDLELLKKLCIKLKSIGKIHKDEYLLAFSYHYLGEYYLGISESKNCIKNLIKGIEIEERNGYNSLLAQSYNLFGILFANLDDEQTALGYFLEGRTIASKNKYYDIEGMILCNIGEVFMTIKEYKMALKYYKKGYQINVKGRNSKSSITFSDGLQFNNIGAAYFYLGDYKKALFYNDKSLEVILKKEKMFILPTIYAIRAKILYALKDKEQAYENAMISINAINNNCDKRECFSSCLEIVRLFLELEKLEDASTAIELIYELAKEIDYPSKWIKAYESIIEYCKLTNDTEKLNEAYGKYYEWQREMEIALNKAKADGVKNKLDLNTMISEKEKILETNEKLKDLSEIDALTGLANRYKLDIYCVKMLQKAKISNKSFGILIIDVDYFKQYNDTYGHLKGDGCIKKISKLLKEMSSKNYFPARYGGDEFFVIITNQTNEQIMDFAKSLSCKLDDLRILHGRSPISKAVTISQGFTNVIPTKDLMVKELVKQADEALYNSKCRGRNCVSSFQTM